jgi:choline-sulfatase
MNGQPNILLIMTDQQRADSLGYAGGPQADTPNLDACAKAGVIFENAYSSSTTCVPARVSLLTGLLPNRTPAVPNRFALQEGFWTIAHGFRRVGYDTAIFGKLHMLPIRANHGFERMHLCEHLRAGYAHGELDDYGLFLKNSGLSDLRTHRPAQAKVFAHSQEFHPTHWITDRALEFLNARSSSRPYFAVVSYAHPHTPYDPPEPYASAYRPEDQTLPQSGIEINRDLPQPFLETIYNLKPDPAFPHQRTSKKSELHVRSVLASIRALIKQIDDGIGRLLQRIDLSNTIVFFTSDHGDFGGHRGFLGKVPWIPFDDLAKVPFFAFGAGIQQGLRIAAPVQSFDYVPTALELAGLDFPFAKLDSISLAPVLRAGAPAPVRPILCETKTGWPMVRRGKYKHIWHDYSDTHALFDLEADPTESVNLANDPAHAELLEENRKLIRAVLAAPILGM